MKQYDKEYLLKKLNQTNRLFLIPYYSRIKKDEKYQDFGDKIIAILINYAKLNNDDLDYVVKVYNDYYLEYIELQNEFNTSGKYKYHSYSELNEVLDKTFHKNYIYVLIISYLTTAYRYEMMNYVSESINKYLIPHNETGIEIGFGTGVDLYDRLKYFKQYDIFEINEYSQVIFNLLFPKNEIINYYKSFYEFTDREKYTFVQLIELMEHLENPKHYIDSTHKILKKSGHLIFTSAVNMANIDHIHLFNSLQSVRSLIDDDKWEIIGEKCFVNSLISFSEEKNIEIVNGNKLPYIVTHVLRKK